MTKHKVGTREEWLAARNQLLEREKELTRRNDELAQERRELPWVPVEKEYSFETEDGTKTLAELFEGRSQLIIYHFMFGPDWDEGCSSCSSAADGIGRLRQLHVRNTTLVAVSRAPYEKLAAHRERMGWTFPWYSSYGSDFNYDFHATLADRVAPVLLHFRTEAELAEAGTPWTAGPWTESMRGEELPESARSCGSATRSSTPTPRTAAVSRNSTTATSTWTSPLSGVRRRGRNRKDARLPSACMSEAPRCACPTSTTRDRASSSAVEPGDPCSGCGQQRVAVSGQPGLTDACRDQAGRGQPPSGELVGEAEPVDDQGPAGIGRDLATAGGHGAQDGTVAVVDAGGRGLHRGPLPAPCLLTVEECRAARRRPMTPTPRSDGQTRQFRVGHAPASRS
jgi:predicted dithiol-disulfide oxidoreductase (DUF899 family)